MAEQERIEAFFRREQELREADWKRQKQLQSALMNFVARRLGVGVSKICYALKSLLFKLLGPRTK
jgi:hypothetical protein